MAKLFLCQRGIELFGKNRPRLACRSEVQIGFLPPLDPNRDVWMHMVCPVVQGEMGLLAFLHHLFRLAHELLHVLVAKMRKTIPMSLFSLAKGVAKYQIMEPPLSSTNEMPRPLNSSSPR